MLIRPVEHLLVVCDGSSASNRALAEGACIADEHEAQMSVVALAAYEERTASCCGGIGACAWNRIQRELAEADLFSAQLKLAGREPEPTFQIVPEQGRPVFARPFRCFGAIWSWYRPAGRCQGLWRAGYDAE